ncbi:ROS1-like protein [Tanacetum coccineum]
MWMRVVRKLKNRNLVRNKSKIDWDKLRLEAEVEQKREKTAHTMDLLDYEAIMNADVHEVADAIKGRGMHNNLAARIKAMLERLVRDHGNIYLEWLRDVPHDKTKEYLLSFRGLGLKSVECIRLLSLHQHAFPVDTNVARIAVRLGWVPLQPLPESLQLHLLELYPYQKAIQQYLWPRLCKLDKKTLYELHYHMITLGKIFCTKTKPNCNACPLRGECKHFASAFSRYSKYMKVFKTNSFLLEEFDSARLGLPAPPNENLTKTRTDQRAIRMLDQNQLTLPSTIEQLQHFSEALNCNPFIKEPTGLGPIVEEPATPDVVKMPASTEPEKQIQQELDIEDFCKYLEENPMIKLSMEEFSQTFMQLEQGDMSKAIVAISSEAASIKFFDVVVQTTHWLLWRFRNDTTFATKRPSSLSLMM